MSENTNEVREITILDILKSLRKRVKQIICIALIALILGGAAGAAFTMLSNATYGAKAEFYITSDEANNLILSLLRSDSFAESLLLDENGLPADKQGTEQYNKVLKLKDNLAALKEEKELAEREVERYPAMLAVKNRAYSASQERYNSIKELLGDVYSGQNPDPEIINEYKAELAAAEKTMSDDKAAYNDLLEKSEALNVKIDDLTREISKANSEVKRETTNILADLRKTQTHIEKVEKVKKSISFSYAENANENKEAAGPSRSLLYVSVAVKFDKALAEQVVNKLTLTLPSYVEDSIVPDKEEEAPACTFVSGGGAIDMVDYENPVIEAIKFALIGLVVGAVGAIGVFIIVDVFTKSTAAKTDCNDEKSEDTSTEE